MSEKKGFLGSLFGGKKSDCCNMEITEEKETGCSCGNNAHCCSSSTISIKILGPGCKNCVTLAENAKIAAKELGLFATVEKITDFSVIAGFGIMSTPGLVVNEKVVSFGKVLKPAEIAKILMECKT